MITLSNGYEINHVAASGTLAFDGRGWFWEWPLVWMGIMKPQLFTVVLKSLTRHPRAGNLRMWKPLECIRSISGGAVNKVGLTNPGIEYWCEKIAPTIDFENNSIVGSIFGNKQELIEMAEILNRFDFVALEVNPSCPNSGDCFETTDTIIEMVKAVKAVSNHPIIVKVSVDQDYLAIAKGLVGIAEAISINSVPWKTAFPNGEVSPLWKLEKRVGGGGGGVSGKPAQKCNWKAVKGLSEQGLIPVIAPSIMEFEDLEIVRNLGAQATSFGAIFLLTPWKSTSIVMRDMRNE